MQEEEHHKYNSGDHMSGFEELIESIPANYQSQLSERNLDPVLPNKRQGHERQIGLRDDRYNTRPVYDTGLPLLYHITFPDVVDNERECVYQSQSKHGIAGPVMKDLKFFMRDTC